MLQFSQSVVAEYHRFYPLLFNFGNQAVAVRLDGDEASLHHMSKPEWRRELAKLIDWGKAGRDDNGNPTWSPQHPPDNVVSDFAALGSNHLPRLHGLIPVPTLRADGTLIDEQGYDPQTKLLLTLSQSEAAQTVQVARQMEMVDAVKCLTYILKDFPFVNQASRTHAIAIPLTLLFRDLVDGNVPIFGVGATAPATGKGQLLNTLLRPIGLRPASQCYPGDDEETRKKVTTLLAGAARVCIFEDIPDVIKSSALTTLATSRYWEDRLLGRNTLFRVRNQLVVVCVGNQLRFGGDLPRRIVSIGLDARCERPEDRVNFTIPDLPGFVEQHRTHILGALLRIGQEWFRAGRPKPSAKPMGSFENWTWVVGGMLETAGFQGFLENRSDVYENAAVEREASIEAVRAIQQLKGEQPFCVSELIGDGFRFDLFLPINDVRNQTPNKALGKLLGSVKGRRLDADGLRVEQCGLRHNAAVWKVTKD